MSQASAYEQYLLELINAERAAAGAQPLAFNGLLNNSAEHHSAWMIATDTFSHTGSGGSTPGQRMSAAGYTFSGSWTWGENIAWATTRSPAGYQDEVGLLHVNLMNSSGHRANILNPNYREVGLGYVIGEYGGREGAFITENFARSGTNVFLTGVAFDDKDGDQFYDVGEGLGAITVTAVNNATGQSFVTATMDAGGYALALTSGTYTVTFSSPDIESESAQFSIASTNVKVDLMDPVADDGDAPPPPPPPPPPPAPTGQTIAGTKVAEALNGGSGNDTMTGVGGHDTLNGNSGNDSLDGGNGNDSLVGGDGDDVLIGAHGNDVLRGGQGMDVLTGGIGKDKFVFDTAPSAANIDRIMDFSVVDDTIQLENSVFTAFTTTGKLAASAFFIGSAAHDATDRIIYDQSSGALMYDPDGTGAEAATQFAILNAGLALTNADLMVI